MHLNSLTLPQPQYTIIIILSIIVATTSVLCPNSSTSFNNCEVCSLSSNTIICSTCKYSYYLTQALTCALCSSAVPRCAACAVIGSSLPTCTSCESNTGLLNGVCQSCDQVNGCANCSILQNKLFCTQCNLGYLLYTYQNQDNICLKCQIANCSICYLNLDSTFGCSSCFNGYFLLNSTLCQPCSSSIQYCTSCSLNSQNTLVCQACASTLLYIANNTCFANCITTGKPNCAVCRLIALSTSVAICSACQSGYYLQFATKNCLACSQASPGCKNCSTVNSLTTCLSCDDGYYLTGSPAVCVKCSIVQPLCASCNFSFTSGVGRCSKCVSGYYLNSTDYQCYSCTSSPYANNTLAVNSCSLCYVNNSFLYCSECSSRYYASNGNCLLCSSVLLNCDQCRSAISCSVCAIGYLILGSNCIPCSASFANCLYCKSNQCTDCQPGYYSDTNKYCVPYCSVPNCLACNITNRSQCVNCKNGYSIVNNTCTMMNCIAPLQFNGAACACLPTFYYSTSTVKCLACTDTNCLYCAAGVCTTCMQGFLQVGVVSLCTPCSSNCRICITNRCLLCDDGYMPLGVNCTLMQPNRISFGVIQLNNLYQLCPFGCLNCDQSLNCLSCGRGFTSNGTVCVQCPQNCAACNLSSTPINQTYTVWNMSCFLCDTAAALINNNCLKCSDKNCLSCDFNPQFCLQCVIKYTADTNGSCQPCLSFCDYCDQTGPGSCDQGMCGVGYTWVNSTVCLPCMLGCSSCNNTFPFTCLGCLVGTYLSANNTCISCQIGCYNCGSTGCIACFQYYILSQGICYPYCQLPCLSCVWTNNVEVCKTCLKGYTLSTGGKCIPNLSCTTKLECEYCPLGYFIYRGQCYACLGNCDTCVFIPPDLSFVISNYNYVSYLNCTRCATGFYLDPSKLTCMQCADHCLQCLSALNCLICRNGYFVEHLNYNRGNSTYSTGICESCISSCKTCSMSLSRCTSCPDGYNLISFRCVSKLSVTVTLTLTVTNPSLSELTNNFKSILKTFYTRLGKPYDSNTALVNILSVQLSSLIITASATIINESSSSDTYNTINSNLQATSSISSYPVNSYSVKAVGFTPDLPSSSISIGVVIAIVGSILALIILIVIVVCWRIKKKKRQAAQQAQREQQDTQIGPATSKNILKNSDYISNEARQQKQQTSWRKDSTRKSRQEVSHISETHSKPSLITEKKNAINLHSVQQPLPRRSNIPNIKSRVGQTNYQKSYSPQMQSEYVSQSKKETSSIPKSRVHFAEQPRSSNKVSSNEEKFRREVSLFPSESTLPKNVSFRKQSKIDTIHLPNQSNFQPQFHQSEKDKKQKKQTDSQRKYIPNKNTYFI